jgi:hypothetical protein
MNASHPLCTHVRLATSEVGEVAVCTECGVVNIVLPFMTLRVPEENFPELAGMLSTAQAELLARSDQKSPEPPTQSDAKREPRLH